MKHFKHPATIIAAIALLAALSGGAGAAVTTLISGTQITKGSIPENRLQPSAIKNLQVTQLAHSVGSGGGSCGPNTAPSTFTWCGTPYAVKFDKKTAVLVTGSLDLATSDGNGLDTELGICYAPHGSSSLTVSSYVYPEFAASSESYFAQSVTGVIGGLKGAYDVGMCLDDQTSNAKNGDHVTTALTTETNKGVKQLGPLPPPDLARRSG